MMPYLYSQDPKNAVNPCRFINFVFVSESLIDIPYYLLNTFETFEFTKKISKLQKCDFMRNKFILEIISL